MTVVMGVTLGMTRIVQGKHFVSDVVMTGVLMWLTVLILDYLIFVRYNSSS